MRLAARTASSTRPGPGVSPCPGRGRSGKILDYCSRDMVPPVGGASRIRETMFSRQMGPFAQYVKQISFLCPAGQAGRGPRNMPGRGRHHLFEDHEAAVQPPPGTKAFSTPYRLHPGRDARSIRSGPSDQSGLFCGFRKRVRCCSGMKKRWSRSAPAAIWHSTQNSTRSEPSPFVVPNKAPSGMIIV